VRARQSIYIHRPPDEVFAFVADHANDRLWRTELVSVEPVGDITEGVGTHLRQTVTYQGRTAEANIEITEWVPGQRICFRAHGGIRAHGCYDLRPEGDGTRFSVSATVELKGAAAMLERYVQQAVERAAAQDLERLKQVLEARPRTQ
jgi:carbon monoxide dehydrogenase subunit G